MRAGNSVSLSAQRERAATVYHNVRGGHGKRSDLLWFESFPIRFPTFFFCFLFWLLLHSVHLCCSSPLRNTVEGNSAWMVGRDDVEGWRRLALIDVVFHRCGHDRVGDWRLRSPGSISVSGRWVARLPRHFLRVCTSRVGWNRFYS